MNDLLLWHRERLESANLSEMVIKRMKGKGIKKKLELAKFNLDLTRFD